jgi:hypothetical protein
MTGRYPDAPGHRGVDTSIAAADAMAPRLGRLQRMALQAIRNAGPHGRTADELSGYCGWTAGQFNRARASCGDQA